MNSSSGKTVPTKGYLNGAATPTRSDLCKSKRNSKKTTEINIVRSSPQSDLET